MNSVNLIPIQRRRVKTRQQRVRAWIIGNSVYLALLGIAGATAYGLSVSEHSPAVDLAKANLEIEQSGKQMQAVRRQLAEALQLMASVRAVSEQPDWGVLVADVTRSLGEKVVLNRFEVGPMREEAQLAPVAGASAKPAPPRRFMLRLSGLGQSQAAVSEFVLRLESTELFERVNVLHTNRETLMGSEVAGFELECPLSTKPGGMQ